MSKAMIYKVRIKPAAGIGGVYLPSRSAPFNHQVLSLTDFISHGCAPTPVAFCYIELALLGHGCNRGLLLYVKELKMTDAINELDYNFNSYDTEGKVEVNDYNIRDYFWKVI